ncbi:MAG: hypothetical protein EXR28_17225 [Betaproteobacteria bacterium]|nr:hypothetical protein [Betaproteobacteria bacterium]
MEKTLDRQIEKEGGALRAAIDEAWEILRRFLESRVKELCSEVRHYPTPIARCDVQLTKLIEQRTHALGLLRRFAELESGAGFVPVSPDAMRGFVACYPFTDDDVEAALVAMLNAALGDSSEPV